MNKDDYQKEFVIKDPFTPEIKNLEKWDVYAKNTYCPKIKVTDWWYHREGYPKDDDDIVRAAYKRWGTWEEDKSHWTTETMEVMESGLGDPELKALKSQRKPLHLLSFLSYPITLKSRKDLLPEEIRKILPSLPRDQLTLRYTTTNQSHYKKLLRILQYRPQKVDLRKIRPKPALSPIDQCRSFRSLITTSSPKRTKRLKIRSLFSKKKI